jgi:hypothetical protein
MKQIKYNVELYNLKKYIKTQFFGKPKALSFSKKKVLFC